MTATLRPRAWSRKQWGVTLSGLGERPMLLGSLWAFNSQAYIDRFHAGEPTRALLFTTRAHARLWVKGEQGKCDARPVGDVLRKWRFRVVRVVETVRVA